MRRRVFIEVIASVIAGGPRRHSAGVRMIIALCCLGIAFSDEDAVAQPTGLEKIQHVIVIYQENWSFDGLYLSLIHI